MSRMTRQELATTTVSSTTTPMTPHEARLDPLWYALTTQGGETARRRPLARRCTTPGSTRGPGLP